jgi:hypothetical protein
MKVWTLIGLILCFCTLVQEDSPVLLGSWTATAAPNQIFGGTWSAQASLHNPNRALGSWTLINDAGDVIRPMKGQSLSGSWTADAISLNAESLAEMLKSTATKEVTGSWRSGRHQGNWSLKGPRTKKLP